jgi:hypothetical protein
VICPLDEGRGLAGPWLGIAARLAGGGAEWQGRRRSGRTSGSVALFDRMDVRCIMKIVVDYVADLYESEEISIREAAEILQLNFRQTMDILEKKVGGNVRPEQETRALNLAKRLAEILSLGENQ